MTLRSSGPYRWAREPTIIRRIFILGPAALLCACATAAHSDPEVADLRKELRVMRQTNERLEQRVARLEDERAVMRAASGGNRKAASAEQPWDGDKVPDLAVVKLKPRHKAAPPVATATPVEEPSEEIVQALLEDKDAAAAAADDGASDAPPLDPAVADALFDKALSLLRTGNVAGGVLELQTFADQNPRHARSDNALFFSGVGLIALDDHAGAAAAFERVLKEYPAGDARLEAMLKLAECRLKLNQREDARAIYATLISNYPGTPAASTAQERLVKLTQ